MHTESEVVAVVTVSVPVGDTVVGPLTSVFALLDSEVEAALIPDPERVVGPATSVFTVLLVVRWL
jgi:hypothetical protein